MDPTTYNQPEKIKDLDTVLTEQLALYEASKSYRQTSIEPRAARTMKLMKGISIEDTNPKSKITGRNKIYFRKIWSSAWRLLATFYQAFLQDKSKFKIWGRDDENDYLKAKVLQFLTQYHLDRLMRRSSAFKKLLWAFMNCIAPGLAVIKLRWNYNEELKIDEPDFTVYPLEQVALDWEADTVEEMRYACFENYITKDQLEEMGYENIDKIAAVQVPYSVLRATRFVNSQDPVNHATDANAYVNGATNHNYPEPGEEGAEPTKIESNVNSRYLALECFYKKMGKIYFCVINPTSKVFLKKPAVSPYGRIYPIAVGSMLLESHKFVPESFPEISEGPQESLNFNLNIRKDATLLAMSPGFIYGRFGGVDKQAMSKIFPGFSVAANDPSQVVPIKMADVGQNAYMEAQQDISMIEEESAVSGATLGLSNTGKTGEAQINLSQGSAKLDLYTAIVGQTLFHQFIYILAVMIQKFETKEDLFKKINAQLRQEKLLTKQHEDIYDIEFDLELDIDVGISEASRIVQSQRYASVIDRMLQMNNSTFMALKAGIKIPNPTIYDTAKVGSDLFPNLGIPNTSQYLVPIEPPPPPPPQGQPTGGSPAQVAGGQNAPQPNQAEDTSVDFMKSIQSMMGGQ